MCKFSEPKTVSKMQFDKNSVSDITN